MDASHLALGLTMALGLLGIGLGAVHWAKTLMPDEEVVEERHPMRASDESRARRRRPSSRRAASPRSITRRPLIKYTLGGALGLFAVPARPPVARRPRPDARQKSLSLTFWNGGPSGPGEDPTFAPLRLMRDPENTPIKAEDVTIGSVFHVMPEGLLELEHGTPRGEGQGRRPAHAPRRGRHRVAEGSKDWGYQGIVAYSKICTHVGCPVGLYEQQTHHLLCPCHQSTFDVTQDCKVIFGPAKRPLPQLQITVDDEGYLVSPQPFQEAVGPSFWERG